MSELAGSILGKYQLERIIGRGGMSDVYRARHSSMDREVAVKVLHRHLSADGAFVVRFQREACLMARLRHPHIVQVLDFDHENGTYYIVLELVEGSTLAAEISARNRIGTGFSLPEAAILLREMGSALDHAHAAGMIHRDLKPGNVLFTPDGEPVIGDFGMAQIAGLSGTTPTGSVGGTPAYMAPEQGVGRAVDRRCDIYSLGVILFQLLTGRIPYQADSPVAMMMKHANEPLPDPRSLNPTLPEEVVEIVSTALEKEPANRYDTVSAFADALARAVGLDARNDTDPQPHSAIHLNSPLHTDAKSQDFSLDYTNVLNDGLVETPSAALGRIAVLPFESLSRDDESRAFTAGIHHDIIIQIAKISGLKPIARSSVMEYANRDRNNRRIARELNADAILEGTVQRANGRIRINVELTDAETAEHLWTGQHDEALNVASILDIQREVAGSVAQALETTLTAEGFQRIAASPTVNLRAYTSFVQGNGFLDKPGYHPDDVAAAHAHYLKAVEEDPGFALAHARLSLVSPASEAVKEAHQALALQPNLPEAHLALARCFFAQQEYDLATAELDLAEPAIPANTHLIFLRGAIFEGARNHAKALAYFRQAVDLDPRNPFKLFQLGRLYRHFKQFKESARCFDRALALAPDFEEAAFHRALAPFLSKGDTEPLRTYLRKLSPSKTESGGLPRQELTYFRWYIEFMDRDFDAALSVLSGLPEGEQIRVGQRQYIPATLKGLTYLAARSIPEAQAVFEQVRETMDTKLAKEPASPFWHHNLALALAALGHSERAVGAGKRAVVLSVSPWANQVSLTRASQSTTDRQVEPKQENGGEDDNALRESAIEIPDAPNADFLLALAEIYALAGNAAAATEFIKRTIERPSVYSWPNVSRNPLFDSIRDHPKWKALDAKYRSCKLLASAS